MAAAIDSAELSDQVRTEPKGEGLKLVVDNSEKTKVCVTGRMYGSHQEPKVYIEGEWVDAPEGFDYSRNCRGGTCPECEAHYEKAHPKVTREMTAAKARTGKDQGYLGIIAFQSPY